MKDFKHLANPQKRPSFDRLNLVIECLMIAGLMVFAFFQI